MDIGYHGKNCVFSDYTERTLFEIYSTYYIIGTLGE